ncbi:hypothetical protein M5689_018966 [Euphorbia peplus]|nr:hypothetical protein M5689_018966 [Euphorbia peplus]
MAGVEQLPFEQHEVTFVQNNLRVLKELIEGMPVRRRFNFSTQYGWIASLLWIPVHSSLVKALVELWDPSYKCFVIGGCDLTPTLEEYHKILNIPMGNQIRLYKYERTEKAPRKLANMMGCKNS